MTFPVVPVIPFKFTGQPYDLNTVLSPDQVWAMLDAGPEDVRQSVIALTNFLNTQTFRNLDANGDFAGTINGMPITSTDPGLSTSFTAHLVDDLKFKNITSASGNVKRDSLLSFTKITPYWDGNLPGPYNQATLGGSWRVGVDKPNTAFTSLYVEESYDLTQVGTNIFTGYPNLTPDCVFGVVARVTVNGNSNDRAPAGESVAVSGIITSAERSTSLYGLWGNVVHTSTDASGSARLQGAELGVSIASDFTPAGGSDPSIMGSRLAFGAWASIGSGSNAGTAAFGFTGQVAYGLLCTNNTVTRAFLHFPSQTGAVAVEAGNLGRQVIGDMGDTIYSPASSLAATKLGFGNFALNKQWYLDKDTNNNPVIKQQGQVFSVNLKRYAATVVISLTSGAASELVSVTLPTNMFGTAPTIGIIMVGEDAGIHGSYKLSTSSATTAQFVVREDSGGVLPVTSVRFNVILEQ